MYKYRTGLWPMQYVFLICSSAGGKKYVTRRSRVTYFLPPALERIKNTYCMGQKYVFLIRSCAGGKKYITRRSRVTYFLPTVRERIKNTYCMGQRPFLFLLLIYERFLRILFYAKFRRYFTQKHGTLFIADVVWT